MLVVAIVFINLACLLYTVGVWAEKLQGRLRGWHLGTFWGGFVCDTTGTTAMSLMAGSLIQLNFHGLTGLTAILLMLFHAAWATIVMVRRDEATKRVFHRFSLVVWLVWLVPMVTGMLLGSNV